MKNKTKSQPKTISRITHQQRSVTNVVEIRTKRRRRRCTHVMGSWIRLINIDHRDDWEIAVLFLYTIEFIVIINFKCSNRIKDALAFAKWTKTKNRITNVLIFILLIIPSLLQSASPLMMMICSVSLLYGCLLPPYPIQSPLSWALCRLTTLLFLNPLTEISRRMTRNVLNVKQFVLWHKWVMSRTTTTHIHTAYPRVNPAAVEPGEVEWQKYHQHFHPPPIYSQLSGLSGANEDEDEAGRHWC